MINNVLKEIKDFRDDFIDSSSIGSSCSNNEFCEDNEKDYNKRKEILKRDILLATSRLNRLHNTEILKKDRKVIEEYNGSGRIHIPSISKLFNKKREIVLPQKIRKGYLKDKPDLIVLFDISGSIDGYGIKNKMRVLCSSIGRVFLADLNQIHIITIGMGSAYFSFNKFVELDKWLMEDINFLEGNTNYLDAFKCLHKSGILNKDKPKLIVMITDGNPNQISKELEYKVDNFINQKDWWEKKSDLSLKVGISKDYLMNIINQIITLSKLKDTIYKTIIINDEIKSQMEYDKEKLKSSMITILEKNVDKNETNKKELTKVIDSYIEEFLDKAILIDLCSFKSGEAYNKIIKEIKKEMYKFNVRR